MLVSRCEYFREIWLLAHACRPRSKRLGAYFFFVAKARAFPSPTPISMLRPSGRSHPRAFGANIEHGGQTYSHNMQTPTHTNTLSDVHTHTHILNHSETQRQTNRPISCWPTVPSSSAVIVMHDRSAIAAIAQLGERQTEDLKVPDSFPGLGTCLPPSFSLPFCFFIFLSVCFNVFLIVSIFLYLFLVLFLSLCSLCRFASLGYDS